MRLGLLGGSFNPVHRCHLSIAQSARQLLALDRVLFIPTGDPPHKQSGTLAEARHRYRMVELAIRGIPEFALTDIEIRRTGKSYSIDTVRAIQQEYGPDTSLFFIIGLDAFLDLPSWKEA
ncbi:MAG: nicotinate (nicotinamide) nucleotide adenylyltransferase, partial [Nitrospira sp.]|nr:nicotinate (nicotinamide) nucleotide adenylyltransferase [Nitrospira sp.]